MFTLVENAFNRLFTDYIDSNCLMHNITFNISDIILNWINGKYIMEQLWWIFEKIWLYVLKIYSFLFQVRN